MNLAGPVVFVVGALIVLNYRALGRRSRRFNTAVANRLTWTPRWYRRGIDPGDRFAYACALGVGVGWVLGGALMTVELVVSGP